MSVCLFSSVLQKFEIEKYKPKHGQTEYDYAKVISDMEKVKNGLNSDGSTSVPGVEAITNLINKTYRFLNQSTEQACTLLIQALTAANTVLDSYREGKIDGRAHAISRVPERACTYARSPRPHTPARLLARSLSCTHALSRTHSRALSLARTHARALLPRA